jgi:catechol 2,3-dioxygenase-like lactoylglutathione lyase family enzyme
MINGAHAILYSEDADATRAALAKVLGTRSVDAGGGWLIFALPPAELAVHPAEEGGRHELYLMTDDLKATLARLRERGVTVSGEPSDQPWGVVAAIEVPGFGALGIYEPRHPVPR